jgi:6,7-dimethyl-8-ribityllumazine synthase
MSHFEGSLDAKGMRVAVVVSRFNELVTERLLSGARDCLLRHGVVEEDLTVVRVPGAWELPLAVRKVVALGKVDAVVAVGALIRGETPHFELLASEVTRGLSAVAHDTGTPVIFGVLTTDTVEQAMNRAGAKSGNKGWEAALSAIETVSLFRRLG